MHFILLTMLLLGEDTFFEPLDNFLHKWKNSDLLMKKRALLVRWNATPFYCNAVLLQRRFTATGLYEYNISIHNCNEALLAGSTTRGATNCKWASKMILKTQLKLPSKQLIVQSQQWKKTRKTCKICSILTIKTTKLYCWLWTYFTSFSNVSIVG